MNNSNSTLSDAANIAIRVGERKAEADRNRNKIIDHYVKQPSPKPERKYASTPITKFYE